ncbi:hypothetical protein DRO25_03110 [Candidatus Bathyarchaeota archaeon]|nr:MAG: hypothetical protein DRO25_03110 [Candidatus Bathyarchaeota archaeon]
MSHKYRTKEVKVLKASSSPIRLQILNTLLEKGPLPYTELMNSLKMNPTQDAGRFAYHLKSLLKTNLIETDIESKRYRLTELGKIIIKVADEIRKKTLKPKRLLVRTSRLALEEFDINKITDSLIKETNMPTDLAHKIARETEKRLLKSKTKYLTAPLVREVVNAILIEKGLEEYRHKLTRLGLPVHDVKTLLENKTQQRTLSILEAAGKSVLEEYTLLNVLPRDIADNHVSGALHISGLSQWILKPSEIIHDLRFFFRNGLNMEKINPSQPSYPPPKSLDSALSTTFNILLHAAKEVYKAQTIDYFNVFLAPFTKKVDPLKVKEKLRLFMFNVSQHLDNVSLGIELSIPDFIAEKQAFGSLGKVEGRYGDFNAESQLIASQVLEIFTETLHKPLFNPKIVIKVRPETFTDEKARQLLLQAHKLAAEKGIPYFANLIKKKQKHSVFSASGVRLNADFKGDWEIDTLRTGILGNITVNLPRIAYESGGKRKDFFQVLERRLEMAARALEIKHRMLKQHGKGLLRFLSLKDEGDQYFRFENSSRLINFAGIREAAEAFYGKSVYEDEKTLEFVEEIARCITNFTGRVNKRHKNRLLPAVLPNFEASERFASLDIERYGVAKVRFSGTREKPFYSTINKLALKDGKIPLEALKVPRRLRDLHAGGSLTVIELGEVEYEPEELTLLTKHVANDYGLEFFSYNRTLTYCANCRKSWFGLLHKCPSCGATSTLLTFTRFS